MPQYITSPVITNIGFRPLQKVAGVMFDADRLVMAISPRHLQGVWLCDHYAFGLWHVCVETGAGSAVIGTEVGPRSAAGM